MELFTKIETTFMVKEAAMTILSADHSMWSNEILAALYNQHPYLGQYQTEFRVDGSDESAGYMYGTFVVKSAQATQAVQSQSQAGVVQKQEDPDIPAARIPVIVKEARLFPLDVFVGPKGKFLPLTQERIEQTLYSPNMYQVAPDATANSYFAPTDAIPDVPNSGLGHGVNQGASGGVMKTGSAMAKVAQIASDDSRYTLIAKALDKPDNARVLAENSNLHACLMKAASKRELELDRSGYHVPEGMVIEKVGNACYVHTFDRHTMSVRSMDLGRKLFNGLTTRTKEALLRDGSAIVTHVDAPVSESKSAMDKIAEVTETGVYTLMAKGGDIVSGVVFNDVRNVDGSKNSIKLAMTQKGASFQDPVYGVKEKTASFEDVKGSTPMGEGVFLIDGTYVTEPLTINRSTSDDFGWTGHYETAMGQRGKIKLASVNTITPYGKTDYLYPKTAKFVPIKRSNGLVQDPYIMDKSASVVAAVTNVDITTYGDEYCFAGGCGIDQLSDENTKFVKKAHALVILSELGLDDELAKEKLATADKKGIASLSSMAVITPSEATKVAADLGVDVTSAVLPLDQAIKLANEMPSDSESVDAVLSLGFVSPESISAYVEVLPEYEAAVNKLAELLIGARLGTPGVKEGAIRSAMKSLDKVVSQLRMLQMESSPEQQL